MKRRLFIPIAALLTAGCAATQPATLADQADAKAPLICSTPDQCNLYWRRAQIWISQNAATKIQIATDTIIETYNPPNYSRRYAFKALKEPLGGGREQIKIAAGCGPAPACSEDHLTVIAAFKRYVRQQ